MEETRFNIHTFMVRCNIFFVEHNVNWLRARRHKG